LRVKKQTLKQTVVPHYIVTLCRGPHLTISMTHTYGCIYTESVFALCFTCHGGLLRLHFGFASVYSGRGFHASLALLPPPLKNIRCRFSTLSNFDLKVSCQLSSLYVSPTMMHCCVYMCVLLRFIRQRFSCIFGSPAEPIKTKQLLQIL